MTHFRLRRTPIEIIAAQQRSQFNGRFHIDIGDGKMDKS